MRYAPLILLAACGGGGPGADWSGKPLDQLVKDSVNNVPFSLNLPAGMRVDGSKKPDDVTRMWQADVSDYCRPPIDQVPTPRCFAQP